MDALVEQIFSIKAEEDFNEACLAVFKFQAQNNPIYAKYLQLINTNPQKIHHFSQIPCLPVSMFKSHNIYSAKTNPQIIFTSSATTGQIPSKHAVANLSIYERSFEEGFKCFYGSIEEYCVLGLLPSYLERKGSSLIYMVEHLINKSKDPKSGFYLYNFDELEKTLIEKDKEKKVLLIGVTFALLDFIKNRSLSLNNTVVMETGGMKGRREELTRAEVHDLLKKGLGTKQIHSEYGMTELLSQAYSKANGIFNCPPWMRILIRQNNDPFCYNQAGKQGGINIFDLANLYSCSFIATDDLGKISDDGFEVLGRLDYSEARGCNLMID